MNVSLPIWLPFALVLVCAVVFRDVRAWLALVAVIVGLYLATTSAGTAVRHTIDSVLHPSTSTSTHTTKG